jgi:chromosome segregation ATPase
MEEAVTHHHPGPMLCSCVCEHLVRRYASVLTRLRQEVEAKAEAVLEVKKLRGRTEEEKQEISVQFEQVSRELSLLKERLREHKGAMKRVKSADKKIESLAEELRAAKSERARVAAKLKHDVVRQQELERCASTRTQSRQHTHSLTHSHTHTRRGGWGGSSTPPGLCDGRLAAMAARQC